MNNFTKWNNELQYTNHINRIIKIKERISKLHSKRQTNHQYQQKTSLNKIIKSYSTPRHLPLPLIPTKQRNLLSSALQVPNVSLKQKQLVLENYLLGRRILKTQPVLNHQSMQKHFTIHKRISRKMSKSLKIQNSLSKVHLSKLSRVHDNDNEILGKGSYLIQIKIINIILIKSRIQNNVENLIRVCMKVKTKKYCSNPLNYQQLVKEKILFCFRKKDLKANQILQLELQVIRKNQLIKLGGFIVDLKTFFQSKIVQKQQRIQNIFNSNQSIIGSLKYLLSINRVFNFKTQKRQ